MKSKLGYCCFSLSNKCRNFKLVENGDGSSNLIVFSQSILSDFSKERNLFVPSSF